MERVLHINDYPADAGGGAEVVMSHTVALLRQRGLVVDTFTSFDLVGQNRTPWSYVNNAHARTALAVKLDDFRPDVVHLHNWYHILSPGILAMLADYQCRAPLRVVMTAHDYHLVCPNAGGSWFRWNGRREAIELGKPTFGSLLARRWDERTVVHSFMKLAQHVCNYRWRHRERVIDLVICPSRFVQRMLEPIGLPTCWLPHPAPASQPKNERAGPLRFVFAGRIEPEKGLCEFIHLLPADFDATLTVIGDGSDLARCQGVCTARRWSERVHFRGRLTHAETLAEIGRCHVLVQPSRVLETYGLTLIEALSEGTNLLVSDRGALREVVDDSGIGFLFDIDSPMSLAKALRTIRQRNQAGTLNRFNVEPFLAARDETSYVTQLIELYGNGSAARRRAA